MKKKGTIKFLLIGIFLALFLLMLGGNVKAENVVWNPDTDNNKKADGSKWGSGGDDVNYTMEGTNNGVKWKCKILEPDTNSNAGKVSLEITGISNTEQAKKIIVPDQIKFKWPFLGFNEYTYNVISLTGIAKNSCIEEISIPENINSIINSNFYDCNNLNKIIVNSNNATYFSDEEGILFNKAKTNILCYPSKKTNTSYTIPTGVTQISDYAFYQTSNLNRIEMSGITSIGKAAFYGSGIEEAIIPTGATLLGEESFSDCKNLNKVVIPDTITVINQNSFLRCTNLKNVDLGEAIETIKGNAFLFSGIEKINFPNTLTSIESCAFACTQLVNVTIPEGVTTIELANFYNCPKLTKVVLPSSITVIEKCAFSNCPNLVDINLQNTSINSIGEQAFCNCENLKDVNMPETLTTIIKEAFANCTSLENIVIPNGVNLIGESCFNGCEKLKQVTLSTELTELPTSIFFGCCALKQISIPSNVKTIRYGAFGCCALESIEIPEGVTSIDENSFIGSIFLKTIVLPSTFKTIEKTDNIPDNYFSGTNKNLVVYCTPKSEDVVSEIVPAYIVYNKEDDSINLERYVDYKENCTEIELLKEIYELPVKRITFNAFNGKTKLTKVILPDTITEIVDQAFLGCTGLTEVIIPANVEIIGIRAFYGNTSLAKIVIKKGSKLTEIGLEAFENCAQNLNIYHDGTNPVINAYTSQFLVKDESEPTATISYITNKSHKYADVTITNIEDENGSGAFQYAIKIGEEGTVEWKDITTTEIEEIIKSNGKVFVYISDKVGNIKIAELDIVGVDLTAPIIVGDITVEGGKVARITANVTDEGESGLGTFAISTNSNIENVTSWKEIPTNGTIGAIVEENGAAYYLYVKDKAGNSTYKTFEVNCVDNEGPKLGSIIVTNSDRSKIKITTTATDASEITEYAIDQNNTPGKTTEWIAITPATTTANISIDLEAPGTYYIHIMDKYNNLTSKEILTINDTELEDLIAPKIEFGTKTNEKVAVNIKDAYSGIASGANVGYAWSESNETEPTAFNTVELNYEEGDKLVTFDTETNSLTGTYYLWVKVGMLKDVKGNSFVEEKAISSQYVFDNTKPSIIPSTNNVIKKKDEIVVYPITFSEEVSKTDGVDATLILPTGVTGEILNIVESTGLANGTIWNITVKVGEGNGEVKLNIPQGLFKDTIGNTLDKDYVLKGIVVDNTKPVLTISKPNKQTVKQNGEVTYTVTSDESVNLIETKKANVTIAGMTSTGTLKDIEGTVDGKTWTVTIVGGAGNESAVLTLPEGLFQDKAGNESSQVKTTEENNVIFDNTAPTITISAPDKTYINSLGTVIYTVTSEEKLIMGTGIATIIGNEGISGTVTVAKKEEAGKEWEIKVTSAQGEGAAKLVIPTGYFTDEAENLVLLTEKEGLTIDNTAPTLETTTPTLVNENKTSKFSITTSDASSGLDSYVVSVSTDVEDIVETWTSITTSPVEVEIKSDNTYYVYVKDKAGNIAKSSAIVIEGIVDNIAPEIVNISEPKPNVVNKTNKVEYVVTMSEAVTKEKEDNTISVIGTGITGGTVVVKQNATANSWTIEVTELDGNGTATLNIPKEFFKDTSNNYTKESKTKEGLTVDNTVLTANVSYEKAENGITVKVISNEAMKAVEGWTLSKTLLDNDTLTKTFTENTTLLFATSDLAGNITNVDINLRFATEVEINSIEPLKTGESKQLTAAVKSGTEKATIQDVTWSSDNLNVVTVNNNGMITGVANGTANITATAHNGILGNIAITVENIVEDVYSVTLDVSEANLTIGGIKQLTATVNPTNATNKKVTWSSSDDTVATVDTTGKVTAVKEGTATITVTTEDGAKTATCEVTVKEINIPVAGVTLNESTAELLIGGTKQLTATVTPTNVTNKNVTWSSSNGAVATVSSAGLITAKVAGTATITVTTEDGTKTATCKVTVKNFGTGFTNQSGYVIKDVGELKYLIGVEPETTIEELLSNVETGYTAKVTNAEGTEITDKTKNVGTDLRVIINKDTTTIEYIVLIEGDCTGDGKINSLDLVGAVRQYKYIKTNGNKGRNLTGAKLLAIKFTVQTEYTAKDLIEEVRLYKKLK